MAAILPFITAASQIFGIVQGVRGLSKSSTGAAPAPKPAPLPEKPTEASAAEKAKVDVARRRRISVLSGGQTNLTRGQALVQEGDIGRKVLLGT